MKEGQMNTAILVAIFFLQASCSSKFIDDGCETFNPETLKGKGDHTFHVIATNKCNPSGLIFEHDSQYSFEITPHNLKDGRVKYASDGKSPLGVDGFDSSNMNLIEKMALAIGQPFRPIPSSEANWYELACVQGKDNSIFFPLKIYATGHNNSEQTRYYTPKENGEIFCLVNDHPWKYSNNKGTFDIKVTKVK